MQAPHLFVKWYVSALQQRDTIEKQGGVIGMLGASNSLSHSCKPRDATRFIGRRTYDANRVFEEADDDDEDKDEEEESWIERIAGTQRIRLARLGR